MNSPAFGEVTGSADSATLLIQHRVRAGELPRYEAWLRQIVARAATYPGHQGVHVIRPPTGGNEYSIVIRYQSAAHASQWLNSEDRKQLIADIEDALESGDRVELRSGIEFWFTPTGTEDRVAPGWKQWLVTTSVIWPLTLVVPPLLRPVFQAVPVLGLWGVQQGIVAMCIVALVVFVIMPRYVRLVSKWLYR